MFVLTTMQLPAVDLAPKVFMQHVLQQWGRTVSGIYFLLYEVNQTPCPIPRLCGLDTDGILYVGMTKGPLYRRVGALQHALFSNSDPTLTQPSASGHAQMGQRYFRIRNRIPLKNLKILCVPSPDPKRLESEVLEWYISSYGELPPLNGQYGAVAPHWATLTG